MRSALAALTLVAVAGCGRVYHDELPTYAPTPEPTPFAADIVLRSASPAAGSTIFVHGCGQQAQSTRLCTPEIQMQLQLTSPSVAIPATQVRLEFQTSNRVPCAVALSEPVSIPAGAPVTVSTRLTVLDAPWDRFGKPFCDFRDLDALPTRWLVVSVPGQEPPFERVIEFGYLFVVR